MKPINLSKRQQEIIWSLLKPYAEGITTTSDEKGSYFLGVSNKKFYAHECNEIMDLIGWE